LSSFFAKDMAGPGFPQRTGYIKEPYGQRRNELPVPLTFALIFPFDRVKKCFQISCNERGYQYAGRGLFVCGKNEIYVSRLECLDSLTDGNLDIPGCHIGLFMRVLLPEIRKVVPAECLLKMVDQPPVMITVLDWSGNGAIIDVLWQVPQPALADCGSEEICLAGDTLYPGGLAIYRNFMYRQSGRYVLDAHERAVMEILMLGHPELFISMPQLQALKAEPIIPRQTGRQFTGPVLFAISVTPAPKDPPVRSLDFVKEARLKREWKSTPVPSLSFANYWPTYTTMNSSQRQWYFYWRSKTLAEEYLPCDLSYLFVYVYELINNIHDNALKRLYALWIAYRGSHPELDVYLPLWILDYILTYHEERLFDLCNLAANFPLQRFPLLQYSEIFFNETLRNGFSALPPETLLYVADYDRATCKVPVDRLSRAVQGLESSFARRSTTLMESFKPQPFTLVRESFRGAVKGRRASRVIRIDYLPYFTQPELRKLLKNTLRYGENILREEIGIPGRLKITGLSPAIKDCIAREMRSETAAARPHLEVNIDMARAIEAVSWQMTRQLVVDDDYECGPGDEATEPAGSEARSASGNSFAAELSAVQRDFLLALLAGKPVGNLCAQAFMLPEAVAEQINEMAHEHFGDTLVDAAKLEIYSEYMSAIADQLGECTL
jgi:hypothetical protein